MHDASTTHPGGLLQIVSTERVVQIKANHITLRQREVFTHCTAFRRNGKRLQNRDVLQWQRWLKAVDAARSVAAVCNVFVCSATRGIAATTMSQKTTSRVSTETVTRKAQSPKNVYRHLTQKYYATVPVITVHIINTDVCFMLAYRGYKVTSVRIYEYSRISGCCYRNNPRKMHVTSDYWTFVSYAWVKL